MNCFRMHENIYSLLECNIDTCCMSYQNDNSVSDEEDDKAIKWTLTHKAFQALENNLDRVKSNY